MSTISPLNSAGEAAWLRLKNHLEWCESFAIVFVFSNNSAVNEIFRSRLSAIYRARITGLELRRPQTAADLGEATLSWLLQPGYLEQAIKAPLWLDISGQNSAEWQAARIYFLARLNERREVLKRSRIRPVVIVLPIASVGALRDMAPDLWAIRHMSLVVGDWLPEAQQGVPAEVMRGRTNRQAASISKPDQRLLDEWYRVKDSALEPGVLRSGWRASEVLGREARLDDKMAIDRDVLQIRRQLVERLGETPESLRDLSVSLNKVAGTQQAQGDWAGARELYYEGLQIADALALALPGIPDYASLPDHFRKKLNQLAIQEETGAIE